MCCATDGSMGFCEARWKELGPLRGGGPHFEFTPLEVYL
jgi:hypothetical protein